ncbi:MAG: chalcone isomerase family protein [Candidatus Kapaibacteriota bacterium]
MRIIVLACSLLLATSAFADITVSGITIPSTKTFSGKSLVLNGAGIREKFWMDMYVGALFVTKKTQNAQSLINADEPMAMELTIVSSLISSDKMSDAVEEGFEKSANGNVSSLRSRIDQFKGFFKEKIKKGDVFSMIYEPGMGVSVLRNGNKAGTISGLDFKKGLFGIWLCDDPADKYLKKRLLGS